MDGLTIFTHMFESTEEAAGCIQKIIDAGPASAVQPEAELPEGTWSFNKRRRVDLRRKGRNIQSSDVQMVIAPISLSKLTGVHKR